MQSTKEPYISSFISIVDAEIDDVEGKGKIIHLSPDRW